MRREARRLSAARVAHATPVGVITLGGALGALEPTLERDEPYEAAFDAFSQLQQAGYTLFVSGNYRRASVDPARFPWVHFLGYVSEQEYYSYLASCALTMDLTVLEDCLLCGEGRWSSEVYTCAQNPSGPAGK